MIDTFLITIPKDTIIYRGVNDKNKTDGNWFAYSKDDALLYGSKVISYKIKKDLKIINIISGFFHIDFMDKLNLKYTGNNFDGYDIRKMIALFPIGLPNLDTQIDIIKRLHNIELKENCDNNIRLLSSYLYDLTRISDYNNEIMEIYANKCDGFTNPIKWPSKIDNRFFNREIYIHNLEHIDMVNNTTTNTSGGGIMSPYNFFKSEKEFNETLKKIQKEMTNSIKDIPILMRAERPTKKNTTRKIKN